MTSSFPASLRAWFADRRRELPWRVTDERGLRDPYRTWISEIMLQQTRVEAVIPYFENFMQQFDGPQALAAASEEQVLKAWAGLGYYRRARLLHAAAASLVHDFGCEFPESPEQLKSLPGIGAYTSAAIASLAFGERIPVVDGNVKRVVARYLALELAADDSKLERSARQQGRDWMEALPVDELAAAGELNEALMELGATVCLPRTPLCEQCPIAEGCVALQVGRASELPLPKRVKKWVNLEMVFLVHRVGARVFLKARQDGWSPGLYEPPSAILTNQVPDSAAAALQQSLEPAPSSGSDSPMQTMASLQNCGVVRHTITHHRIRAHVFLTQSSPAQPGKQWLDPDAVPLTGLARKVLLNATL
ncbi:MAG: A/G-specific adenine glycosylase [Planctomycetes bacterium]|nr:A/G-specific adenine glycosylase [Planctomycetota bacterium]